MASRKLRIVTPSTAESRGFAASVAEAARREVGGSSGGGSGGGCIRRRGGGRVYPSPSSSSSKIRAFQPRNSLNNTSRPARATGGGGGGYGLSLTAVGKRGKRMAESAAAAAAAAGGGGIGDTAVRPTPLLVGDVARGERSSGQLSRKRNLQEDEVRKKTKC